MSKFEVIIASLPHRENLVAEIYFNNLYWAQISQEKEELVALFYPHPNEKCWEFPLDEALLSLELAKKKLLGLSEKRQ